MIKLCFISLIFLIAGIAHLINPEQFLFLFPPWVPFPIALIYATGVLELLLVLGLLQRRWRSFSAYVSAAYLLMLNLVHLYVAWEEIPMMGYDSPWVLWGRFVFQFVLIYWAYCIGRDKTTVDVF